MADRHTILIRVHEGRVSQVLFCNCGIPVTLEVRTYEERPLSAKGKGTEEVGPHDLGDGWFRDEFGTFRSEFHEPEDDEECDGDNRLYR